MRIRWREGTPYALGLLWAVAVALGLGMLLRYSFAPGAAGRPPSHWPTSSALGRPEGLTLVMLVHPQCACSKSTLSELSKLMANSPGKINAHVLLLSPQGRGESWGQTPLSRTASSIPGVRVWQDPDGIEARRFGAFTSGQTVLYDGAGQLRFHGGITPARGHEGDNPGREAITAIAGRSAPERSATPVFGCALFRPRQAELSRGPAWPK